MNIDLRNISSDFENEIIKVKKKYGISTNSKAVEYCVVRYLQMIQENEKLRSDLNLEKNRLEEIKNNVKSFSQALRSLDQIT